MKNNPIFVTKPYLPPLNEFIPYLENIWESGILTNNGPYHNLFEELLCKYLGVNYISLCSNGTIGLILGMKALGIHGDVITTPYSFIATAHSLLWNELNPIFVDIDPISLNIDPRKIENAITEKTSAILAVHCYGRPCDVGHIQKIADKYKIKVIYDAAHAFGVKNTEGSILQFGDISVLSFHATKVFHTFEGGAIVSKNLEMKRHIDKLKNFGFENEVSIVETGINGKMSEINAALGILQLQRIDELLNKRKLLAEVYKRKLKKIKWIELPQEIPGWFSNNSYFPIFIRENFKFDRDDVYEILKSHGIFSRRYFYPLITNLLMYKNNNLNDFQFSENASHRVICLPIYPSLEINQIEKISDILINIY